MTAQSWTLWMMQRRHLILEATIRLWWVRRTGVDMLKAECPKPRAPRSEKKVRLAWFW
jgi:hypothetical protein